MKNDEEVKKGLGFWRVVWRLFLGACVLIAVAWVSGFVLTAVMEHRYEREIEKIRAAGEPVTFKELWEDLPEISEQENAARYYEAALSLMVWDDGTGDVLDILNDCFKALPAEELASADHKILERYLEENSLAFDMVDQAAKMSRCQFSSGVGYSVDVGYSHSFSKARKLIKLLSMRTKYYVQQEKIDKAIESLSSSLGMLRIYDRDHILTAALIRIACTEYIFDDIRVVIEYGNSGQESLKRLERELSRTEDSINVKDMAIATRVCELRRMRCDTWSYVCVPRFEEDGVIEKIKSWLGINTYVINEQSVQMQEWHKFMLQGKELQSLANFIGVLEDKWPDDYLVGKNMCMQDGQQNAGISSFVFLVIEMYGRLISTARSMRVVCAIEGYRVDTGKLPGTLAELEPGYMEAVPLDPFTGEVLKYRQEAGGYVVYGVGEDMEDDGGTVEALEEREDCGVRIRRGEESRKPEA
ncbi:MAG: hypothetical protein JXD22_16650 [Sedimentisphaerales bacterium]|nr:hypothetical protein [Sedimentisphaerales bacterium]